MVHVQLYIRLVDKKRAARNSPINQLIQVQTLSPQLSIVVCVCMCEKNHERAHNPCEEAPDKHEG